MKGRWLPAAVLVVATCGSSALASSDRSSRYSNPVFAKDFPDPMVLRLGGRSYYAYATDVGWSPFPFPILHSTDLIHWKTAGHTFTTYPSWASGDFWAPDVVKHGKTYYLFYTGMSASKGVHCIGVATATKPTGPFRPRNVVGCGGEEGLGYIDPDPFIDRDGKAYLYVSVDQPHHIAVIPLAANLLSSSGPTKNLFGVTQSWEQSALFSTVEGPFMVRHGSTYYLFYSGNSYNGAYGMGVATSDSPLGPFAKFSTNPVLRGDQKVKGPGGGSAVLGPDGNLWMAYHAWTGPEGYPNGGVRSLRIDPFVWHGDKPQIPVHP